ncbi:MAG: PEP-CTERM sorting domain-containing protein [Azoarcus sp.]|jgi:hypothetical protein|nr:PEP-CTERM sorting domain-containing protein [Azoarcus sp.]
MSRLFTISLLTLGVAVAAPSAHADLAEGLTPGELRNTASADGWMVKYLGGLNYDCSAWGCTSNETFNWAAERSYTNGILNDAEYKQVYSISEGRAGDLGWETKHPWISAHNGGVGPNGYYSYVTTVFDDFSSVLGNAQTLSFDGLSISYATDDHLHAIIINGIQYSGFTAENPNHPGWTLNHTSLFLDYATLLASGIDWNINGSNTIEFITHNNNSLAFGKGYPPGYLNDDNAAGLSASVRAEYQITAIPEPETYAMMLAGLAMIGAVARRRNKSL